MTRFLTTSRTIRNLMAVLLLAFSLTSKAQDHQTPQGTGATSHSEQSQDYRHKIEGHSGYDVPQGGLLTQPWVWTLTCAGIVLLVGLIYKSNTDPEIRS